MTQNILNSAGSPLLYSSTLTRKFQIGFRRRRRGGDDQVRVRPSPLLEVVNVIAQDVEIGINCRGRCTKLWIKSLCSFKQLYWKTSKDNICPFHLRGETGKLIDLLWAEIRLNIITEVFDQLRDSGYDRRTEQLLPYGAHDDILIFRATKSGILADTRDH
jgi:hypothetical protein